jgi:hypothetical protein
MFEDASPDAPCLRHYLSELLLHGVLFRPATNDELDRLARFAAPVLAEETPRGDAAARVRSITRITTAAWMTTGALFRGELGEPGPDPGRVALTAWELGQQLAYAVGARAPGAMPTFVYPDYSAPSDGHLADVAKAAADGTIKDDAIAQGLFVKNAGGTDPKRFDLVQDWGLERRTRRGEYWLADGVSGFFREWLGYAKVTEVFKERPEALSRFDDGELSGYRSQLTAYQNAIDGYYGYEPMLVQQLDDAIARVVTADKDVFKNLLSTRLFYAAAPSEYVKDAPQIYNIDRPIADDRAARWVTMPTSERAGVLTHPAWLAAHGGNFEDDPSIVHRGKWIRESLLCGYVPPLGAVRARAVVGPHAPNKSARMRVDDATGKSECQGCHQLMNPLGYPFEIYNHAGYVRVKDHAADGGFAAPDGSSVLSGMPDPALDGPVRDAVELAEKLAASNYTKRCFLRQTFRHFMGRDENITDACTLTRMEQAYDGNGGSFMKTVGALIASDTWKTRSTGGGR